MPLKKAWLSAARPRTLPLALSSVGLGAFLAAASGKFNQPVFWLSVITTLLLQVVSNLANDYGDSIHGADSAEREGPARAVQSGSISSMQMRNAIITLAVAAFISGLALLYIALPNWQQFWLFLALGLLAIAAAVTYTAGAKPYGYAGLGDISVYVFFGLLGVAGAYYLHTQQLPYLLLLPASTLGLYSVAVLNVNNIRDINSDRRAGKKSIPVRLGPVRARKYHWLLILLAAFASVAYVSITYRHPLNWLFVLALPLTIYNAWQVQQKQQPAQLDPYLKQMALSTLVYVVLFGVGQQW